MNNLKIAWTNILRNKLHSVINIFGLGVGISATSLILVWVLNEYSYDGFHKDAERIYRINSHLKMGESDTWYWPSTPYILGIGLKERFAEIETIARLKTPYNSVDLKVQNDIFSEKHLAYIDTSWFDLFNYEFLLGRSQDLLQDIHNIAISESKAIQLFGKSDPIGKIIQKDSTLLTVAAVYKNNPTNSSFAFDVLVQNSLIFADSSSRNNEMSWSNFNYQTYIKLQPQSQKETLAKKLTTYMKDSRKSEDNNTKLILQPLIDVHFNNLYNSAGLASLGDKNVINIFALLSVFIIVLACINYVNLTTASAFTKIKGISVKKILGANKMILFSQFMMESILISSLASALALFLIVTFMPTVNQVTGNQFSLETNPECIAILCVSALVTILLSGIYPSIFLAGIDPLKVTKGLNMSGKRSEHFRKALVVLQFSVTILVLMCTMVIHRQLNYINTKPLGYTKENIFTIEVPWYIENSQSVISTFIQKIKGNSSILDICVSNSSIANILNTHSGSIKWDGKDPKSEPSASLLSVSNEYGNFFNLQLSEGKWMGIEDTNMPGYVLNETAIKTFALPQPYIGQNFELHGKKGKIVGVVKDFHFQSLRQSITPLIIFGNEDFKSTINVKVLPGQSQKALEASLNIWKELVPNHLMRYEFLDDTFANLHISIDQQLKLFMAFTLVVLLISCIGLFGLSIYSAESRIKELGVRKVLGASMAQIFTLLSTEFLGLVILAIILSTPITYFLTKLWLQDFAYCIHFDIWIVGITSLIAISIALLTVSYQAIKAAMMNPVKSLKTE